MAALTTSSRHTDVATACVWAVAVCRSFSHRDIPARYLLRLGMGERDLDVDDDFSRAGRVNNMLARRLTLLAEVCAGAVALPAARCDTAGKAVRSGPGLEFQ